MEVGAAPLVVPSTSTVPKEGCTTFVDSGEFCDFTKVFFLPVETPIPVWSQSYQKHLKTFMLDTKNTVPKERNVNLEVVT